MADTDTETSLADDEVVADRDELGVEGEASDGVVNQDEIDSLLGFDSDVDPDRIGNRAIVNSALVSYERLPMLEVISDRLVRMMTTSLRDFTSDSVEASLEKITSIRFGDYLEAVPVPAILGVFRAEEWDNYGLLTVDTPLIYSMVDVLLGGRRGTGAVQVEDRPYTTIERSLVKAMIEVVLKDLSTAFEPLSAVNFKYDRIETNPRFATIARPANAAILIRLRVAMEERGGTIELLLPYATLEPVRELLLQMFMGEKFGRDSIWESHLATELWYTKVQIDAVLDEKIMELGQVMDLEIGDTVMFNSTRESEVELRCGDVSLLAGRMGRIGSTLAIRVTDQIKSGEKD